MVKRTVLTGILIVMCGCTTTSENTPNKDVQKNSVDSVGATHSEGGDVPMHGEHEMPAEGHQMTAEEHAAMGHEPEKAMLSEEEAYERARPVFEQYCARCHTSAGNKPVALRHFTMDTYPFGGHHASEVAKSVRDVLGANGKAATMPLGQPGAVKGEQLRLVLDWADAFDRAHAKDGASEHHGHQH
jgi:mono/diheme cytochrome c family protein